MSRTARREGRKDGNGLDWGEQDGDEPDERYTKVGEGNHEMSNGERKPEREGEHEGDRHDQVRDWTPDRAAALESFDPKVDGESACRDS